MRKLIVAAFIAALMMAGSSFAQMGALYTGISVPAAVTSNTIGSSPKAATGSFTTIIWLVSTGDASINTIAKQAGITKIYYVDEHVMSILNGLYAKVDFTIYGE
jgi:hypothetical protein